MLTLFALYCLAGVWVRDLTQESLLIEKGTELLFTLCSCSPPGPDLILSHCPELPRALPASPWLLWASPSRRLAQGPGRAGRGQRGPSFCLFWAVESHRPSHPFSCSRPNDHLCRDIHTASGPAAPCSVAVFWLCSLILEAVKFSLWMPLNEMAREKQWYPSHAAAPVLYCLSCWGVYTDRRAWLHLSSMTNIF